MFKLIICLYVGICLYVVANAQGCDRAHCSSGLTGLSRAIEPPSGQLRIKWSIDNVGTSTALGCSSNGYAIACNLNGNEAGLSVIDTDGNILWKSSYGGKNGSGKYAPLIFGVGNHYGIITKDDDQVSFFNSSGIELWRVRTRTKFDPMITNNGRIIFGGENGGLFALSTTGLSIASIQFKEEVENQEVFFQVLSTSAIDKNRLYTITGYQSNQTKQSYGALYAVDCRATQVDRLKISWKFLFKETPLGYPLYIYDATGNLNYVVIATDKSMMVFRDDVTNFSLIWKKSIKSPVSFVQDPTNGFWVFSVGNNSTLTQLSITDGTVIQTIDVAQLVKDKFPNKESSNIKISSLVNIAGFKNPIMLFTIDDSDMSHLIGLDFISSNSNIVWMIQLGSQLKSSGQFPVVKSLASHEPQSIVFATNKGVFGIGK